MIAEQWLAKDSRLRASLIVPSQEPDMAAREIERVGGHPGFVQVFCRCAPKHPMGPAAITPSSRTPCGTISSSRSASAARRANPPTPSGWPSFYLEEFAGMASIFQSQLMSLIFEGVFDRFPLARDAGEGGFTWLPSLLWRWDKEWKGLRRADPVGPPRPDRICP